MRRFQYITGELHNAKIEFLNTNFQYFKKCSFKILSGIRGRRTYLKTSHEILPLRFSKFVKMRLLEKFFTASSYAASGFGRPGQQFAIALEYSSSSFFLCWILGEKLWHWFLFYSEDEFQNIEFITNLSFFLFSGNL